MKKTRRYLMILAALALMLAALTPASARSNNATRTYAPVTWFTEPDRAIGSSMLVRTDDAVRYWFATSELQAQEAITIWWIVFNNPDGCSDPCSPDDIFIDGDASLGFDLEAVAASDAVGGYSTGKLTNAHGWVVMTDRLEAGAVGDEIIVGEGPILKDARTAEVHLVARTHGPAIPGLVDDQLASYGGGCETFFLPGTYPTGVGGCSDIQSSIHLP